MRNVLAFRGNSLGWLGKGLLVVGTEFDAPAKTATTRPFTTCFLWLRFLFNHFFFGCQLFRGNIAHFPGQLDGAIADTTGVANLKFVAPEVQNIGERDLVAFDLAFFQD